jgi:hypothetical protein
MDGCIILNKDRNDFIQKIEISGYGALITYGPKDAAKIFTTKKANNFIKKIYEPMKYEIQPIKE